jgi:hypothetical protein
MGLVTNSLNHQTACETPLGLEDWGQAGDQRSPQIIGVTVSHQTTASLFLLTGCCSVVYLTVHHSSVGNVQFSHTSPVLQLCTFACKNNSTNHERSKQTSTQQTVARATAKPGSTLSGFTCNTATQKGQQQRKIWGTKSKSDMIPCNQHKIMVYGFTCHATAEDPSYELLSTSLPPVDTRLQEGKVEKQAWNMVAPHNFVPTTTAVTWELLKSYQSWVSQIDNSLIGSSSFMSVALLPCSSRAINTIRGN